MVCIRVAHNSGLSASLERLDPQRVGLALFFCLYPLANAHNPFTEMTPLLVYTQAADLPNWLTAALKAAGFGAAPVVNAGIDLVRAVCVGAPAALLCWSGQPDDAWFSLIQDAVAAAPCAVLAFVHDPLAEHAERATAAGIHLYRTDACAAADVPALLLIAQARFKHEQALQQAVNDAALLLEERKVVDRAKSILMQARQVSDDDAFRMLRTASMHSNQRLGQVGQHIIQSARFAEGVNRSGQLRMLSQRLLVLYLFELAQPAAGQGILRVDTAGRIDSNLTWLGKSFSDPALALTVKQVAATWLRLRKALQQPPQPQDMARVDTLAEQLLDDAERLTAQLEEAGAAAPLQVLNMAGRQRMLSQRYAKGTLLGALGNPALAQRSAVLMRSTRADFDKAMHYLNNLPLSSPDIRSALADAKVQWQHMQAGAHGAAHSAGCDTLARASEALLGIFERLTGHYEHSLQMLVG